MTTMPPTGDPPGATTATDAPETAEAADLRWSLTEVVTIVLMQGILVVPYLLGGFMYQSAYLIAAGATGLLMIGSLLVRRRHPTIMLIGVTVAGIAQMVMVPYPTASIVAVPIAVYSFARWVDGRRSRLVLVIGTAAAILGPLSWTRGMVPNYDGSLATQLTFYVIAVAACAALVVTPYAFGRRLHDAALVRESRARRQAERYQTLLAEREQAARMAEVRARAQIARELHDVVAHSLSVMVVQAEGGKALATKRPEAAADVLGTIAETGRDALSEMRRIVGVLRGDGEDAAEYHPNPTLEDIPDMVRRAGERVQLTVHGTAPQVPPSLALNAYRVTQEAVTNVLKHAGPTATAHVQVHYEPQLIVLEIKDNGHGSASRGDGQGNGLKGMRERVGSMGGELVARPMSSGGFLVRALLPVPSRTQPHPRWATGPATQGSPDHAADDWMTTTTMALPTTPTHTTNQQR